MHILQFFFLLFFVWRVPISQPEFFSKCCSTKLLPVACKRLETLNKSFKMTITKHMDTKLASRNLLLLRHSELFILYIVVMDTLYFLISVWHCVCFIALLHMEQQQQAK